MKETKVISLEERAEDEAKSHDLEKLLSEGARKLLQTAIENEVVEYLETHQERRSEAGQRAIVRNGYHPGRELVTGIGLIKVRQPRIRHRDGQKFSSAILPPYMRRVPSIDALIPAAKFYRLTVLVELSQRVAPAVESTWRPPEVRFLHWVHLCPAKSLPKSKLSLSWIMRYSN